MKNNTNKETRFQALQVLSTQDFLLKLTTRERVMLSACCPRFTCRKRCQTYGICDKREETERKRDNEHRTAHNPKRGAHTNWVGASMVHRGRQRNCHPVTWAPVRADSSTLNPELNNHNTREHRTWQKTFTRSPSKRNIAATHVQPTLRPAFQRAEPSELERVTEKQWRLKCLSLSYLSHFSNRTDDISVAARLKSKN